MCSSGEFLTKSPPPCFDMTRNKGGGLFAKMTSKLFYIGQIKDPRMLRNKGGFLLGTPLIFTEIHNSEEYLFLFTNVLLIKNSVYLDAWAVLV